MSDKRNVDQLVDTLRDYVRALMGQGQTAGHENVGGPGGPARRIQARAWDEDRGTRNQ